MMLYLKKKATLEDIKNLKPQRRAISSVIFKV